MAAPREIKVFIASPGDLAVERRAFKDVIDQLNAGFGRGAEVRFVALGWEDALSTVGRRSQAVINRDVDACDVFVLVMWRRWGQEAPDAAPYSSYTEEEFYRALARWERDGTPTIFVFFKHIDPGQMADPGPQMGKVLDFRRRLELTRQVLYRSFDGVEAFRQEIDTHLVAYAKGEFSSSDEVRSLPIVPDSVKAELEKHRAEAHRAVEELEKLRAEARRALDAAERARAQATDAATRADATERVGDARSAAEALALAEKAAKAALEGKIEIARQGFAKALDGTTDLRVLSLGFEFFQRIGELDEAERLLRRWVAICGPDAQTLDSATAYGNLGVVMQTRGRLDEAEAMYRKALAIDERLGRLDGMANQYGNLGLVLRARGDLRGAEAMHRKALAIDEKLGHIGGTASQYGNLGLIYQVRGDLDGAEAMYRKALAIDERLSRPDGMANQYGNLGLVLQTRGDLDGAEVMYRKALAVAEKLGSVENIIRVNNNLGLVYQARGDLEAAAVFHRRAFELAESMGSRELAAQQLANLGDLAISRGRSDEARRLWREAVSAFTLMKVPAWRDVYERRLRELSESSEPQELHNETSVSAAADSEG